MANNVGGRLELKAVEKLFHTTLTDDERAELEDASNRHNVPGDHPVLMVIAEMILQRRKSNSQRDTIDANLARISNEIKFLRDEISHKLPVVPAPVKAQVVAVVPYRLSIWPSIAIGLIFTIVATYVASTYAILQISAHSRGVAAIMTTPAGRSAWHLIEANGDQLPRALAQCKRFSSAGRTAMQCTLWDSAQTESIHLNILATLTAAGASLPSWPFAIITVVALALLIRRNRVSQPQRIR